MGSARPGVCYLQLLRALPGGADAAIRDGPGWAGDEEARLHSEARHGDGLSSTLPHVPGGVEAPHFPRAVPCGGHSFDDALVCRCGMSWWAHQRLGTACPLNARACNRGQEARGARRHPGARHRHS